MCSSPRRRLTPGNSEKAEKKETKRTGFLEESGAERECGHGLMGNVVTRTNDHKEQVRYLVSAPPRTGHVTNIS